MSLLGLEVRDFVHIAQAGLEPPAAGLGVLTGETGVGKSLLIDALALALGGRLGRDVVRDGAGQAEIRAMFAIEGDAPGLDWLERHGFADSSGELLLRRTIDRQRRSRAYINGRAATVAQLAEIGSMLIRICGQHEHMQLRSRDRRRELLDRTAGSQAEIAATAAAYAELRAARERLEQARAAAADAAGREEELREIIGALEGLGVSEERLEEQNRILTMQANAAELAMIRSSLGEAASSAAEALARCRADAQRLAELDPDAAGLAEQLASLEVLSQEAEREAERQAASEGTADPEALAEAEGFVAECHRLARRHRLVGPQQLPELLEQSRSELEQLAAADLEQLEAAERLALEAWAEAAGKLSGKRAKAAKTLAAKVQRSLRELGMPAARFAIELIARDTPSAHGAEEVEFVFAARKSGALAPLAEVASGGELSRIALALFTHAAEESHVLVFDEVDAGVGGRAAAAVGGLLAELARRRLVLCVTHLPQVAAAAAHHWRVESGGEGADLLAVSGDAREEEIARMLAGRKVTQASRDNARDILAAAS